MQYIIPKVIEDKKDVLEFLPACFEHLTRVKKVELEIEYTSKSDGLKYSKVVKIKTAFIINLMHKLIHRVITNANDKNVSKNFNLSAVVLRGLYGTHYNYVIDFLLKEKFLILKHGHLSGKYTTQYEVNTDMFMSPTGSVIRYRNNDSTVIRKWKLGFCNYQLNNISDNNSSYNAPIYSHIKQLLTADLTYVEIDINASNEYLNKLLSSQEISTIAYQKNLMSVEQIHDRQPFFVEDKFGRFHTNFTTLKKAIRANFLKIDGYYVAETDIKNSQPRFLCIILKSKGFDKNNPEAYKKYYNSVKNGTLYEEIMSEMNCNREDAKKLIYKVFFGKNYDRCKYNNTFKKLFPEVWNWIVEYKKEVGQSAVLAWELQKKESYLVFEVICSKIKKQIPNIKLFTVHDSIYYPEQYKDKVEEIFFKEVEIALG